MTYILLAGEYRLVVLFFKLYSPRSPVNITFEGAATKLSHIFVCFYPDLARYFIIHLFFIFNRFYLFM